MKARCYFICIALIFATFGLSAQDGRIHAIMLEPVFNQDMIFDADSCTISFSYSESGGALYVKVFNKTKKRAYIEWENARIDNSRVVFGDDSRLTMGNAKADESIPSNSNSISRHILSESWVGSEYIINLIASNRVKERGGSELEVILPIRFGDTEPIDYKFRLSVYYYNPVDCSQITIGMKAKDVRKLLGKPDYIDIHQLMGTSHTQADWYYASNAIIYIDKGVVEKITSIKKQYIE